MQYLNHIYHGDNEDVATTVICELLGLFWKQSRAQAQPMSDNRIRCKVCTLKRADARAARHQPVTIGTCLVGSLDQNRDFSVTTNRSMQNPSCKIFV